MTGDASRYAEPLIIKLEYVDFITAAQISHILGELDRLYMVLLAATNVDEQIVEPDQARLRIRDCRTGQSLELVLTEGVKLVLDPATQALVAGTVSVAGLSLTVLIARVLTAAARTVVETRTLWHEGTREREEARKLAAEREEKARAALAQLPDAARRSVVESGHSVVNEIEYSPNITQFYVNGNLVLTKAGRERRTFRSSRPPE